MKPRVAILISGRGSNMAALIRGAATQDYPAQIAVVIANRADAQGLEKAQASGVPTLVIESKSFGKDRAAFETPCRRRSINTARPDLSRRFHAAVHGRVRAALVWQDAEHSSLAVAVFPGLDPHGQALRAGVKISGATVHFVIPQTDAGPILMQGAVAVSDHDTAETLSERILEIEHRIYPAALRLLASGQVRLDGEICRTVVGARRGQFPDLAGI